jgi:hypothetical protein
MDGTPPTYEELVDLTRRQAGMIESLRAEVERLKKELEDARRAGKRQAAPFSKGFPKADPKQPGRKPGHPPSHRPTPPPEQVDRTILVPLSTNCPECHEPLGPPRSSSMTSTRSTCPSPSRSSPDSASRWPAARPASKAVLGHADSQITDDIRRARPPARNADHAGDRVTAWRPNSRCTEVQRLQRRTFGISVTSPVLRNS